jgi:hypothetical protein
MFFVTKLLHFLYSETVAFRIEIVDQQTETQQIEFQSKSMNSLSALLKLDVCSLPINSKNDVVYADCRVIDANNNNEIPQQQRSSRQTKPNHQISA